MCTDVYSQLLMALVMPDSQGPSCYPVRISAAGAITTLLDVSFYFSDLFWTGMFLHFSLSLISVPVFFFRMTTCHPTFYPFSK